MRTAWILLAVVGCTEGTRTRISETSANHPDDSDEHVDEHPRDAGVSLDAPADAEPSPGCFGNSVAVAFTLSSDSDHDGVDNAADNCPWAPNAQQYNEDGDVHGDACDECPIYANDSQADADCDHVSDPCDPRPTTPGDRIVFFEGFNNGVPSDWYQSGPSVTAIDGAVVLEAMNGSVTIGRVGSSEPSSTLFTKVIDRVESTSTKSMVAVLQQFVPGDEAVRSNPCFLRNYDTDNYCVDGKCFCYKVLAGPTNCMYSHDIPADPQWIGTRWQRDEWNADPAGSNHWCMQLLRQCTDPAITDSPDTVVPQQMRGSGLYYDAQYTQMVSGWNYTGVRVENARATLPWLILIENP